MTKQTKQTCAQLILGKEKFVSITKFPKATQLTAVRNGDEPNCVASSKYNIYWVQEQLWMKSKEYLLSVTLPESYEAKGKKHDICVKEMNLQLTWKRNYSTLP